MTIELTFDGLKAMRQTALIPFITGGYPSLPASRAIIELSCDHGADIIEIGVPFSDPIADGPTIQYASQAALDNGTTLKKIFDMLKDVRVRTPLVLMSYLNPVLAYGPDRFFPDLAAARVAGLVVPDLPVEESTAFQERAQAHGLALIPLVAPTSTDERIRLITGPARGFVYCVSTTGTTGARAELDPGLLELVGRIRTVTSKPVAVGFGISTPEQVRGLHGHADGVIIGSRIIEAIRNNEDLHAVMTSFKDATRR